MKRTIGAVVVAVVTIAGCGGGGGGGGETPDAASTVTVTVTAEPEQTEPAESSEPAEEPTTEATTSSAGGDVLTVGDTFTTPKGGTLTLLSAERRTEGLEFDPPPARGVFLEVVMNAVAGSQGGSPYPIEFVIRDSTGSQHEPASSRTTEPGLAPVELTAGEQVRGALLYDIPDGPVDLLFIQGLEVRAVWTIP